MLRRPVDNDREHQKDSFGVRKSQFGPIGKILYALSHSSRKRIMQLLHGPFSITSLIVAYLFPCEGITVKFCSSVPQNKQFQWKKTQQNEKSDFIY